MGERVIESHTRLAREIKGIFAKYCASHYMYFYAISYGVCSFVNGSAHCSGCVVYGPSAMAAT